VRAGRRKSSWKRQWLLLHEKYLAATEENARLRAALDELNEDVEEILSRAHQEGHEAAKSWLIRAQRQTIHRLKAQVA